METQRIVPPAAPPAVRGPTGSGGRGGRAFEQAFQREAGAGDAEADDQRAGGPASSALQSQRPEGRKIPERGAHRIDVVV